MNLIIPSFNLYGFFIALGILVAYLYCIRHLNEFKIKKREFYNLFIIIFISSLIGARIYHVISWFSYYKLFPVEILYFWNGGLGIFGALLGGIVGTLIYSRIHKIRLLNILNMVSPSILLTQAIGRIGNFFNHEGFGPPTNIPWKTYIPMVNRPIQFIDNNYFHPTFFYESILCLLAFLIYLLFRKRIGKINGLSFYLITYGLIRIITESFRLDTWTIHGFKIAYFWSLTMIILGTVIIHRNKTFSVQI